MKKLALELSKLYPVCAFFREYAVDPFSMLMHPGLNPGVFSRGAITIASTSRLCAGRFVVIARSGEELRTGESRVAFLQAEMTMLMIQRAQLLLRLSLLRRTVRPRDCCGLGQRENVPFLSFPYVCPKPVLVK